MDTQRTLLTCLGDVASDLERESVRPPAIVVIGGVVAVANPEVYPDWKGERQHG